MTQTFLLCFFFKLCAQ